MESAPGVKDIDKIVAFIRQCSFMSYNLPDDKGHFDQYGGVFVAETLMTAVTELKEAYEKFKDDPDFLKRV